MGAHGIWIFPSLLKPFPSFQLRVPLLLWSFPKISHFLFMEIKWETMGIHLLGEWVFDTNNSFSMLAQDLIQKEKERNKEGTSYLPIKSKIFMHSCIPLKAQGRWSLQGSRCLAHTLVCVLTCYSYRKEIMLRCGYLRNIISYMA